MSRIDDFLIVIDDPTAPPLRAHHPGDDALLNLLAHLAFSDGEVSEDEFALLERLKPGVPLSELLMWVNDVTEQPIAFAELAEYFPEFRDREDIVRFAARMVCMDGIVASAERQLMGQLCEKLSLPSGMANKALDEVVARGGSVSPERLGEALRNMLWRHVAPDLDDAESALVRQAPASAHYVCRLLYGEEEVALLYREGIVAGFADGPQWLEFTDIRYYTRVPVPGASFHVHMAAGEHHVASDHRLADLGALLDFLLGRVALPDA